MVTATHGDSLSPAKDPEERRRALGTLVRQILDTEEGPIDKLRQLLDKFEEEFGREDDGLVLENVSNICMTWWRSQAEQLGENSIEALIRAQWEPTADRYPFTVHEVEDGKQVRCTKCPTAELFAALGREDLGKLFICSTDQFIVQGFNPKMRYSRSMTIMEGDEYCDHTYVLSDKESRS